ncbi:MAG: flagellar hook-basal body complex protein FliE [Thermoleophilia bacterium]|nr:flagellar hook-basal body complex protein FliE [Thermoleophilia bacterium]
MATGAGGIGGAAGAGLQMPFELLDGAGAASGKTGGADPAEAAASGGSFAGVLKSKLSELSTQQADAASASQDMATGRVDDVAQTMLRIEQANVSLQMATQVRNKVIEAYQEVLRMQM